VKVCVNSQAGRQAVVLTVRGPILQGLQPTYSPEQSGGLLGQKQGNTSQAVGGCEACLVVFAFVCWLYIRGRHTPLPSILIPYKLREDTAHPRPPHPVHTSINDLQPYKLRQWK
jgi:hypothetical protein